MKLTLNKIIMSIIINIFNFQFKRHFLQNLIIVSGFKKKTKLSKYHSEFRFHKSMEAVIDKLFIKKKRVKILV